MRSRWLSTGVLCALLMFVTSSRAANPCLAANGAGQDLEKAGKLREAREKFALCSQRSCNPTIRTDCEAFLIAIDEKMPTVIVRVFDSRGHDVPTAKVSIDGSLVVLDGKPGDLDPGPHVFRARAKSGDTIEQRILVVSREKDRVITLRFDTPLTADGDRVEARSDAPRPPPPATESTPASPNTTVPVVLAGVGGAGLLAFAVLELIGQSEYSALENGCLKTKGKCSDSEIDPVRQKFVFAGVALGISVVALASAAVVYFATRSPSAATPKKSSVSLERGAIVF